MKTIKQTHLISGGNPAAALAAGAAVVAGVASVGQSFDYFIDKGEKLGGKLYDHFHPDNGLGKMVYYKDDYTPAYLNYKHPNNYNGDSFHSSFGGF